MLEDQFAGLVFRSLTFKTTTQRSPIRYVGSHSLPTIEITGPQAVHGLNLPGWSPPTDCIGKNYTYDVFRKADVNFRKCDAT